MILRIGAEVLADGILPDVPGYGLDGTTGSQDVIVKFVLPELFARTFEKFVGRVLLEGIHEGQHVADVGGARGQEVEMVGHGAVGVDRE